MSRWLDHARPQTYRHWVLLGKRPHITGPTYCLIFPKLVSVYNCKEIKKEKIGGDELQSWCTNMKFNYHLLAWVMKDSKLIMLMTRRVEISGWGTITNQKIWFFSEIQLCFLFFPNMFQLCPKRYEWRSLHRNSRGGFIVWEERN